MTSPTARASSRSPTACWVARHAWLDVNVRLVGGRARAASSSTRLGSDAGGPGVVERRAPARARRGGRGGQHPRALRPHLRQRARCARSTAPSPLVAHEDRPRTARPGRSGAAAGGADDRRARARRRAATTVAAAGPTVLLGAGRRPRRPGGGGWSTPAAATPPATWWSGSADADVLVAGDLVEESAPPAGTGLRRRLLPAGVARDPRPGRRPARRPARWSSRGTALVDRDFVAEQRGDDRGGRRDDPRPGGRGVPVDRGAAPRPSGRSPPRSWATPFARGYAQLPARRPARCRWPDRRSGAVSVPARPARGAVGRPGRAAALPAERQPAAHQHAEQPRSSTGRTAPISAARPGRTSGIGSRREPAVRARGPAAPSGAGGAVADAVRLRQVAEQRPQVGARSAPRRPRVVRSSYSSRVSRPAA